MTSGNSENQAYYCLHSPGSGWGLSTGQCPLVTPETAAWSEGGGGNCRWLSPSQTVKAERERGGISHFQGLPAHFLMVSCFTLHSHSLSLSLSLSADILICGLRGRDGPCGPWKWFGNSLCVQETGAQLECGPECCWSSDAPKQEWCDQKLC